MKILIFVAVLFSVAVDRVLACPDPGDYDDDKQAAIISALTATANSCVNNSSGKNPANACNVFVGAGLQSAYKISDFFDVAKSHYYTSDELLSKLPKMEMWQFLGTADTESSLLSAQKEANLGKPVVAVASGHVALIIPGNLVLSTTWETCVPNSASESTSAKGPHYIGKRLSNAWPKEDRLNIQIWGRKRSP